MSALLKRETDSSPNFLIEDEQLGDCYVVKTVFFHYETLLNKKQILKT